MLHQRTIHDSASSLVATVGGVGALIGTYWDDSWHTDRGRDSFAAPPHLVLYAGVLVAMVGIGAQLRRPLAPAGKLALAGGAAVLATAPIDEFWHTAFGRDAVLWSPPHLTAVAASVVLSTGVLGLARRAPGRLGGVASVLAAAAVIGSFQIVVLEFDSDVPQFPSWSYLPVAVGAWLLSVEVIERITDDRGFLIWAATTYTAVRLVVVIVLDGLGHSGSVVPPAVALALLHIALRRSGRRWAAISTEAAAAVLAWFVWLEFFGAAATPVDQQALLVSLGIIVLIAVVRTFVVRLRSTTLQQVLAVTLLVGFVIGAVALRPAYAHDPGQGLDRYPARLEATRIGDELLISLRVTGAPCADLLPRRTVARRAGTAVEGTLVERRACSFEGRLSAPLPGRWFAYVELEDRQGQLELWVPVDDEAEPHLVTRPIYQPVAREQPQAAVAAGVVLYAAVVAMLVGVLRAARRIGSNDTRARSMR